MSSQSFNYDIDLTEDEENISEIDLKKISPTLFLDFYAKSFIFQIKPCKDKKMIRNIIERGSGEVVSVAGPYTIPLISPDMQYEGEDEVFSFNYITDCARNNRQLDLNRYRLNKQSQFKPEFNFRDILEKKITWSEARSRWKIDDINLDQNPLPQTLCSVKPTNRSYSLKEEQTILKYIADNNMYDKVKGRQMWQFMASSRGINKRTWQSLKEHYIKSMIPRIDSFDLTKEEKNKFMWKFV